MQKYIDVMAAAGTCFRKSPLTTEDGLKPDSDLVFEMLDRKIRVQDLVIVIDSIRSGFTLPFNKLLEVRDLASWYGQRVQMSKIDVSDESE